MARPTALTAPAWRVPVRSPPALAAGWQLRSAPGAAAAVETTATRLAQGPVPAPVGPLPALLAAPLVLPLPPLFRARAAVAGQPQLRVWPGEPAQYLPAQYLPPGRCCT